MKKLILMAAILFSSSAFSENWVMIKESVDESRLLVNVDSFQPVIDESDKNSPIYYVSEFKVFFKDSTSSTSTLIIDASSCKTQNGMMYSRKKNKSGQWETINTYFWSIDGTRLYDVAGEALCFMAKNKLDSDKQTSTNKKQI